MKFGESAQLTTVLPSASTSSRARSAVAALVPAATITSTRRIRVGGLKKCMPTTRAGSPNACPISPMLSEEVLDATMSSGPAQVADLAEQRALDRHVLDGCLDQDVGLPHRRREVGRRRARERR